MSEALGIHLEEKLDFNAHLTEKISKDNKGIGIIKKLQSKLPRNAKTDWRDRLAG